MGKYEDWVASGKPYDQGLGLLAGLTRNRVLLQSLSRKRNPEKLRYELKKIAHLMPETLPIKPLTATIPVKKPEKKLVQKEEIKAVRSEGYPPPDIRTKIIHQGREVRYESLPVRLQKLYDQNRNMYKEMRALHEKSKLVTSDAAREPLIVRLVHLDVMVRSNWNTIDSWDGQPDVESSNIDHRRINANRKFISDNKKLIKLMGPGSKRDDLIKKIQSRVDELLEAKESLDRVRKELEDLGIKFS